MKHILLLSVVVRGKKVLEVNKIFWIDFLMAHEEQ